LEPGDVIIQFNGRPIKNNDELVRMVVATKPGTSVAVKVLRNKQEKTINVTVDELDLEAEQNNPTRRTPPTDQQPPEEHGAGGFGLTLENVTPQVSRRLRLPSGQSGAAVSDVDPDGPSAALLRQGDVILSVNSKTVASAADAARELQKIEAGHIAQMRVWRGDGEIFVPVKKE
jgi:serine protease Do